MPPATAVELVGFPQAALATPIEIFTQSGKKASLGVTGVTASILATAAGNRRFTVRSELKTAALDAILELPIEHNPTNK
jgi:hypothetical protein